MQTNASNSVCVWKLFQFGLSQCYILHASSKVNNCKCSPDSSFIDVLTKLLSTTNNVTCIRVLVYYRWFLFCFFWFRRYLTSEPIWHFSQSFLRPSNMVLFAFAYLRILIKVVNVCYMRFVHIVNIAEICARYEQVKVCVIRSLFTLVCPSITIYVQSNPGTASSIA